jgi:hypothetical protein
MNLSAIDVNMMHTEKPSVPYVNKEHQPAKTNTHTESCMKKDVNKVSQQLTKKKI